MSNVRKAILLDETAQAIKAGIKEAASNIAAAISGDIVDDYVIYGFHINGSESDPGKSVTYLEDAVGMTPARMDYLNNKFSYGSWIDAFFMPRPCMVKYDGTVDYYLDPNDYDKKENGELSDIGDPNTGYGVSYQGNAMMEWGSNDQQIWTKVLPDDDDPTSGSVYISNRKVDDDYTAWSFINYQGNMVKHFYTAIYNSSLSAYKNDGTTYYRLRSIPRRIVANSPGNNNYDIPWDDDTEDTPTQLNYNTEGAREVQFSINNNPGINLASSATYPDSTFFTENRSQICWFTEVFCDIQLINNLLILISKSLNTQESFGNGNMNGNGQPNYINNGILYTASSEYTIDGPNYSSLNKSGLFWGSNGNRFAVKVFGMENWWGNQWHRYAGHIGKSSSITNTFNHFIKNTFGTEDGSTSIGYNTDGTGYIDSLCEVAQTGYIKSCKFFNTLTNGAKTYKFGTFLNTIGSSTGTASTYYCDQSYRPSTYLNEGYYAVKGGRSSLSYSCGIFYTNFGIQFNAGDWSRGSSISFKPLE